MSYYNGPTTVTNGLVMYLDAANRKSYPGSGTSWSDLSGLANNGTTSGGPTFSSANVGNIVFDGTDDKVDCGNNSSLQITVGSISAWFNATNANSGYNGIIAKQNAWGLFVRDNLLVTYDWGNGADRNTGITVGNSTWNHAVMTFTQTAGTPTNNARIYLNGTLVLTATVRHSNHNVTVQLAEANANQYLTGNIAQASIYNRVLSGDEVRQNYNATKTRFGL
jgi:hypothetical protein